MRGKRGKLGILAALIVGPLLFLGVSDSASANLPMPGTTAFPMPRYMGNVQVKPAGFIQVPNPYTAPVSYWPCYVKIDVTQNTWYNCTPPKLVDLDPYPRLTPTQLTGLGLRQRWLPSDPTNQQTGCWTKEGRAENTAYGCWYYDKARGRLRGG